MTGTIIGGTHTIGITLSSPTYNPATVTGLIDIGGGVALARHAVLLADAPLIVGGRELAAVRRWVNGLARAVPSIRGRVGCAEITGTHADRRD